MEGVLARWEDACAGSAALRFVDVCLRGVGQVMLQDNPLTGLLFLLAVAWGALAAGAPYIFLGGLLGLIAATLMGYWVKADAAVLRAGLCGYNGVLVGLALPTFLAPSLALWIYVAIGGAVSTLVNLGAAKTLKPSGAPTLTFPFVLVTWLLLLASYGFARLPATGLPAGAVVAPFESAPSLAMGLGTFTVGALLSISQVFLKASAISALLLLVGLAANSLAGGGVRAWRRGSRNHRRASFRRGERPGFPGAARLQSGPDGDRARRHLQSAGPQDGRLCGARRRLHCVRPGCAERRPEAVCNSGAHRAFRSGVVDVSASAEPLWEAG